MLETGPIGGVSVDASVKPPPIGSTLYVEIDMPNPFKANTYLPDGSGMAWSAECPSSTYPRGVNVLPFTAYIEMDPSPPLAAYANRDAPATTVSCVLPVTPPPVALMG